MSFHINTEKEKNKKKYDRVMKSVKDLWFDVYYKWLDYEGTRRDNDNITGITAQAVNEFREEYEDTQLKEMICVLTNKWDRKEAILMAHQLGMIHPFKHIRQVERYWEGRG